jgi:hypothetical protein
MTRLSRILILSVLCPLALPGQQQPTGSFAVGSRVRVKTCTHSPSATTLLVRREIGEVLRADSGTIILQTGATRRDTIPSSDIVTGWRSAGRRSRWATGLRGLVLGAAAGSILGQVLDLVSDNRTGDGSGEALESVLLPLFGGVVGGSIGAVVGIASGGEQWKRVPLSSGPPYGCNGR